MTYTNLLTMDSRGRIMLPATLRKMLELKEGDLFYLSSNGQDITLMPCATYVKKLMYFESCLDILKETVKCGIVLCTKDKIISAKNIFFQKESRTSDELRKLFSLDKEQLNLSSRTIYPTEAPVYPIHSFFPIKITASAEENLGLLLCTARKLPVTEQDIGSARLTVATIKNHFKGE